MDDNETSEKVKRGYLDKDFLFFHLCDQRNMEYEFHYHDFDKIIIFISGEVTYIIEGKSYALRPWDILMVGKNDLHQPIISPKQPYERIVLWLNPLFLERHKEDGSDLQNCFKLSTDRKLNLIRLPEKHIASFQKELEELEVSINDTAFGSGVLRNSLFLQLIVKLNRLCIDMDLSKQLDGIRYDEKVEAILNYINRNLEMNLSIEMLSKEFFVSKYYLMHLFKNETGYTLHNYILKKRIVKASELIRRGIQVSEACSRCGFGDYSSFVRAFKKEFQLSPRDYLKSIQ